MPGKSCEERLCIPELRTDRVLCSAVGLCNAVSPNDEGFEAEADLQSIRAGQLQSTF